MEDQRCGGSGGAGSASLLRLCRFFLALCRLASDLSIEGGSHLNKWL